MMPPIKESTLGKCNGRRKLNQFGDYDDVTNMSGKDWDIRWAKKQTRFHVEKEHPMLIKYVEKLTQKKPNQRIFVPLCGKTLDMKWLADRGHEVVGNEYADEACQLFFKEHNIEYTKQPLDKIDGCVYKATDGTPVEIYRCDCFDLTSDVIGTFDCIWDRGGFVALPVSERNRYASMIHPLARKDCRYLLDTFLVDNGVFGGPPFNCTEENVKSDFGKDWRIEKLDQKDVFGEWQKEWGVTSFVEEVFLLQSK